MNLNSGFQHYIDICTYSILYSIIVPADLRSELSVLTGTAENSRNPLLPPTKQQHTSEVAANTVAMKTSSKESQKSKDTQAKKSIKKSSRNGNGPPSLLKPQGNVSQTKPTHVKPKSGKVVKEEPKKSSSVSGEQRTPINISYRYPHRVTTNTSRE